MAIVRERAEEATDGPSSPAPLPSLFRRPGGDKTAADWEAFEEGQARKHELRNGEFREMAGASPSHNDIFSNLFGTLFLLLSGTDCKIYGSDMRIHINGKWGYHADVVVVQGERQISVVNTLLNPFLIAEILSPSTAADDRGEKWENYRTVPSLRHYILLEQSRPYVEHWAKSGAGLWTLVGEHKDVTDTLSVAFGETLAAVPLAQIYHRVSFEEAAETGI